MKRLRYIVLCFIILNFLTISINLYAEVVEKTSAFMGRHFIVAFMQNEIERAAIVETSFLSIFVSSTRSDTVIVSIPGKQRKETIYLEPNKIEEVVIENDIEVRSPGIAKNKQIDISSKHPITCWVYSSKNQSSDSYVAIPVSRWGKTHRIISMPNDVYNGKKRQIADNAIDSNGVIINNTKYQENLTPRTGEFLVIADLDSTIVTFIPTANTINGIRRGSTGRVRLNKGEVLLVQSEPGDIGSEDLTGTYVSSNHPIGLLSGHVRSSVKQGLDLPYDTKDHLVEMMPATNFWGRTFITIPFINGQNTHQNLCASGDLIKVIARDDSTKIDYFIHESDTTFIKHTKFIEKGGSCFEIEANCPIYWNSDKPILVNQLMMHKGIVNDTVQESLYYDPSLVILAPVEQFVESVTFATPRNNKIFDQYKAHCVIVIADSLGIDNLYLDNILITDNNSAVKKKRIGDTKYYWLMLDVKNGNHKLNSKKGSFSGVIYGHGYRDSYSMMLGSRLNDADNPDIEVPKITYTDTCGTIRIKVSDFGGKNTGIDWGEVTKNTYNFNVHNFEISDTATVLNITANPIDLYQDASLEIAFVDKSFNKSLFNYKYYGFKVKFPENYDFGRVNWVTETTAELKLTNNSKIAQNLNYISLPDDKRLRIEYDFKLPYNLKPNETVIIKIILDPDGSTKLCNTDFTLHFDCDFKLTTHVTGEISSPGLIAQDINFGKIRLGSSKTISENIVNAGNIKINVTSLENINSEKCFSWDISPKIPYSLDIGEYITYTATFTPKEIKQYKEQTKVNNDALLDCYFNTIGDVGVPNIENIALDFGKHRIGTTTIDTVYLINNGSFNDTINFVQDINVSHINNSSVEIFHGIKNVELNEQDSIALVISFIPNDTELMYNKFEFKSAWEDHQPIFAVIEGQGTIPVIETFNYEFDSIPVYSISQDNVKLLSSKGNEDLTIDSIFVIDGDVESFEINYEELKSLRIKPNDQLVKSIIFKPIISGEHVVRLGVVHDANPNYLRSIDTIVISGYATADDEKYKTYLRISELNACNTIQAELVIENNGSGKIYIDSILINRKPDVYFAEFVNDKLVFPIILEAGNNIIFPIKVYAERNQEGELELKVYYNGEIEKILSANIFPHVSSINCDIYDNTPSITVGDTVSLNFNSFIEYTSEGIFEHKINIAVDKTVLYLLNDTGYIDFITDNYSIQKPVKYVQYDDYIEVSYIDSNDIVINLPMQIQFNIDFLVLLSNNISTNIIYELISDRCYNPGIKEITVNIQPVCGHNIRQIRLGDFNYLSINENPVSNNIRYTINLSNSDIVDLSIFDINGKIVFQQTKLELERGKHSFSLDISNLQSSEYFISVRGNNINDRRKIIVVK